jgi:hypothetical protein
MLSTLKIGQKVAVKSASLNGPLSDRDMTALKSFYANFKKMRESSLTVLQYGNDAKSDLAKLQDKEPTINDELVKILYKNKELLQMFGKLDQEFIDIFSKLDPRIFK